MKKTIPNIIAINEISWYTNPDTQKHLETLPLKTQWTLRKNMKILEPMAQRFNEFRDELTKKRNEQWFVEGNGKCDKITDENGEEVLKIKDEFMDEFTKFDEELNSQIRDIILEEEEINLHDMDNLDSIVESLPEDTELTMTDLDMLEFFSKAEEQEAEEE